MKRIIQIIAFLLFAIVLSGLMGFIYLERGNQLMNEIDVRVYRDTDKGFVNENELYSIIGGTDSIQIRKIKNINTNKIEEIIGKNPYVKNVDVFVNINNNMIVNVKEKKALLRIFNQNSIGYYIDTEAGILPLSQQFTPRVLIANGYINAPFIENRKHIFDSAYNATVLQDLYTLTTHIVENDFLKAQISQIYVNSKGEFDLIPQLGNQLIQLGCIANVEEKLEKLQVFYKKALVKAGWKKYKTINLKYKNQVVCTRK